MIRALLILICLLIVGYLSYEWVLFFNGIDAQDHEFVGFLFFVGSYCLVLFVLVSLGWSVFFFRNRLSIRLNEQSPRLMSLTIYLTLFLVFWWIVRAAFSAEDQFVPENMLLAGVGLVVVIISKKLFEASKQKQLQLTYEKDRREAELTLLKSQVNPHFLFNALNTLYNDALKIGAEQMTSNLEMLTDILRYQLQYASQKVISLEEEVHFIQQYVDFQKHRLQSDEMVQIEINTTITDPKYPIHPMILITFIENAFKHGVSREKASSVYISMTQESPFLRLIIRNSNHPKQGKDNSGIGLEQAEKLLQVHYPSHKYLVDIKNDIYQVTLTLNLKAHE
ncbi:MAG: histidine kinase [Cytophagales bacterium]|nr:histidine kinase [Cytophagales bacterium]